MGQWSNVCYNDEEMPTPFAKAIAKHAGKELPVATQTKLGTPQGTNLQDEHVSFLKTVIGLIDTGKIDTKFPQTFLHVDVYEGLSPEWKAKTDRAIPNIATLLERIMDLHARPEKNESYEMKNLIEHLFQAKRRIEEHADVFTF